MVKLLPALGKRPGGKAVVKQLEPEWTEASFASFASFAGRSPRRSTSTGSTEPARSERCGPAGGSNYEEARGAESPADFVHKTRIALKEVRETRYWLRLAARAELLERTQHLATLIDEADQLVAILTASANTARQRAGC